MVVPADLCWGLTAEAQQVVIMGTQYYDGSAGGGGTDYPVTDLLQMMGRAVRAKDTQHGSGRCEGVCTSYTCREQCCCRAPGTLPMGRPPAACLCRHVHTAADSLHDVLAGC